MNEQQFSRSIMKKFNSLGYDCTRIESHTTGVGIPDLFIQGHGTDQWIELKCDMKQNINQDKFNVPWRPGQQAWMMRYIMHHAKQKCGVTLMRVEGGIVVIAHVKVFKNNIIYTTPRDVNDGECLNYCIISDELYAKKSFNVVACIYNLCYQALTSNRFVWEAKGNE